MENNGSKLIVNKNCVYIIKANSAELWYDGKYIETIKINNI